MSIVSGVSRHIPIVRVPPPAPPSVQTLAHSRTFPCFPPPFRHAGCYDGNVYERLYKMALRAPLNTTEVFPQHYGEFERFLDKEFLARGNRSLNEPEASL